jgi:uncharacterized cupredoxin-like copper-binding protein
MKKILVTLLSTVALILVVQAPVRAAGDLTRQEPIEVRVSLGDSQGAMKFSPAMLEFETGKLYKLVLHNPSATPHYFSSEGLARSVYTRKAQVLGPDGKRIAEIKGFISAIEVFPSGTAEWWFVPIKTAPLVDLKCTVEGHAEAGMVGSISIK